MPHTRLFIMALVVVTLVVDLARSWPGRRRAGACGPSCRTGTWPPSAACQPARRRHRRSSSAPAWPASPAWPWRSSAPIGFQIGHHYIIDAFLVVIVGGLGKLRGAVIAAVALGLLNSFTEYWTSASIGKAIVFVAVIVFLQFRPNGIVSFRTRGLTT